MRAARIRIAQLAVAALRVLAVGIPKAGIPGLGILSLGLAALGGACAQREHPNLLLVTVDTLRADQLACYGGSPAVGTAMCGLADRGVRFAWALSTAPSTAPSIASIMTSQLPRRHGVTQAARTTLSDAVPTLAESLAGAGYDTAAFVSNPVLVRARRLDRGFAIYDDRMTRPERNRGTLEREAGATTDAALAWLGVAREPWFLWVHFQDPHGPYEPPQAPRRRDAAGAPLLPVLTDHSGLGGIPAYQALPGLRSAAAYRQRYQDEIRHLDIHVARLLAGADARGRPPVVVLTADHGEALGEDGVFFAHGHSVGLDQVRVPLLVRPAPPGEPRTRSAAVSTLDVAPTLLAAAGLTPPAGFEGRPLPLDAGASASAPRPVIAQHRLRAAVVLDGVYYARDRAGFDEPVADPVSGGKLQPLPPRTARLAGDALPAYAPADATQASQLETFEQALAREIARGPAAAAADGPRLSDSDRQALRALGYLE